MLNLKLKINGYILVQNRRAYCSEDQIGFYDSFEDYFEWLKHVWPILVLNLC